MATIRGYLPVRVRLPSFLDETQTDETFLYLKEHQQKDAAATGSGGAGGDTLFVTNAPVAPGVRTRLLLTALLGRFGEVRRVTVIDRPHKPAAAAGDAASWDEGAADGLLQWTPRFGPPRCGAPSRAEGAFAHVVFTSGKELRRALRALQQLMAAAPTSGGFPAIELDRIELQTLRDATDQLLRDEAAGEGSDDDGGDDRVDASNAKATSRLQAVVERYRQQCRRLSRPQLLEECNRVMESFEQSEEDARQARTAAMSTPDDDGFVTVSYASQVGSKKELDQDANANRPGAERRRKGQKRNRKNKKGMGASELPDFYRFQTKVNKKRTVQELRERFEEDLAKLKKMKDEKQFRPF